MVGTVVAFGFAIWRRERLTPPAGQRGRLVVSALLNFSSFMISSTTALLWLKASEAVIIAYTLPLWAALLAWPILGERPTIVRLLALALGLSGVAVTMSGQPVEASWEEASRSCVRLRRLCSVRARHGHQQTSADRHAAGRWGGVAGRDRHLARARARALRASELGRGHSGGLGVDALHEHDADHGRLSDLVPCPPTAPGLHRRYGDPDGPTHRRIQRALLLGEPLGWRQLAGLALTLTGVALAARR